MFALHCHCRDWQRASGTGHVHIMGMSKAAFSVTGETKIYATVGRSTSAATCNSHA